MEKVRLGELVVDRRVWVRENISLDHVRCLVNDLVNGAEFPPLKVDRRTRIIIGGNHRYRAYRNFYGEGWEEREVDVEFKDLPPFEEDPAAWYAEALKDNRHLVERLQCSDRNKVARNLLAALGDPDSPQAKEFAEILHFTPQGWKEFAYLVLDSFRQQEIKLTEKTTQGDQKATETHPKTFRSQKPAKSTINDIYPSDVKDCGVNAQIMSKANGLIAVLKDLDPDYLSDRSRELLEELMILISDILEVKAS